MEVTSITETWGNRSGGIGEDFERKYTRSFQAVTDDPRVGPLQVMADARLPRLYTFYVGPNGELDTGAFVTSVRPQQDAENPQVWEVTVEYGTRSGVPGTQGGSDGVPRGGTLGGTGTDQGHGRFDGASARVDNPLRRPYDLSFDFITEKEVARVITVAGFDGLPVQNSAGDAFDPPVERDLHIQVLKVTANMGSFDPVLAYDYLGRVNDGPYLGFAARRVLLAVYRADRAYESGFLFWKVYHEFHFHPVDWDLRVLDQGYRKLPRVNGKLQTITDGKGKDVAKPQMLDGFGGVLPEGGEPVFLTYRIYRSADFAALGLF